MHCSRAEAKNTKVITGFAFGSTSQDREYIILTMNSKHGYISCLGVFLLQDAHKITVSHPKYIYWKLLKQY